MPGMNGFELAQMVKQRKKTAGVPIIFLTAFYSEDQHVLEGYVTGAVDYLHKPINPAILRSKVAVFADLYRKTPRVAEGKLCIARRDYRCRRAQEELRQLTHELEERVAERTAELVQANMATMESEVRLKMAQSAGGVGVWDWDIIADETFWSETMWSIYGIEPVAAVLVQRRVARSCTPMTASASRPSSRPHLPRRMISFDLTFASVFPTARRVGSKASPGCVAMPTVSPSACRA